MKKAMRLKVGLLTLMALLTAQTAWAEKLSGAVKDHFYWIFETTTGELTLGAYEGLDGVVYLYWDDSNKNWTGTADYILTEAAVERDKVKSVIIEKGITSIQTLFFSKANTYNCRNLESVTVTSPDDLTIDNNAFVNSEKLKTFYTGGKVTSIGGSAFEFCRALETIQNDSETAYLTGLTAMGKYAFFCSGLKSFKLINSTAIDIPESAFQRCKSLESVTIMNVGAIGDFAFYECSALTSFTPIFGPTSIGEQVFGGCNLEHISLTQLTSMPGTTPFTGNWNMDYVAITKPTGTYSRSGLGIQKGFTPFTLLYVGEGSTVTDGDNNTIIGDQCSTLSISGTRPFKAWQGFTADKVIFPKDFEAGRYYSICLPYVYKNADWTFFTLKNTQSKIADDNTLVFEEVDQEDLKAGTPYIVYTGKKSVTGIGTTTATKVSSTSSVVNGGDYYLSGNFEKTMDTGYLVKNYSSSYIYTLQSDGTWAYMDHTLEGSEITPFTAFIYVSSEKGSGKSTIYSAYGNEAKTPSGLEFSASNVTIANGDDVAAMTPTLTNPNGLDITYTSSDPTVATVDAATGELTLLKGGSTTITAITPGNETYANGSASYILTVENSGETPDCAFSCSTMLYGLGETAQAPKLTLSEGLTATYTSSNTKIVEVDAETGALTIQGTGTATITATTAGNMQYNGATASYTAIVLTAEEAARVRCDANGDGSVSITDAVTVVNYILKGSGE